MLLERLQSLPTRGIALDTETHAMVPGQLCPPLVCGSAGWLDPGSGAKMAGILLPKQATIEAFWRALSDPDAVVITANGAFDLGVIATECARAGFDAMPLIFAALERHAVYDVQIAEALNAIADGNLGKDPRTGGELKNPETGRKGSYSLAACVDLVLGRKDAKLNDEYRLRYHELENIPIEQWPLTARQYPVDDACGTGEVALAQTGHIPKTAHEHNWQEYSRPPNPDGTPGAPYSQCADCGSSRLALPCMVRRPHANLHQVADQTYSAFCLHLGAAWGFRVDQRKVDVIERHALAKRDKLIQPFIDAGIISRDEDGTYHEHQSVLKRMVAIAYGAKDPCPHCKGTGEVPTPAQKPIRCGDCKGSSLPDAKDGPKCREWRKAHAVTVDASGRALSWWCARCQNTGKMPHPNPNMINCVIRGAVIGGGEDTGEDDVEGDATRPKVKREPDTKTCDGTGLVLPPNLPKTDSDGVGTGKDPLAESGDEFLMSLAFYKDDAKILKDYIPWFRTGRACVACGQPGTEKKPHADSCAVVDAHTTIDEDGSEVTDIPSTAYHDIALTPRPNVVLDTLRVSYWGGYLQLLPRQTGFIDDDTKEYVPSLRECIVARGPRYEDVEVPDDYVLQAGEERVA